MICKVSNYQANIIYRAITRHVKQAVACVLLKKKVESLNLGYVMPLIREGWK